MRENRETCWEEERQQGYTMERVLRVLLESRRLEQKGRWSPWESDHAAASYGPVAYRSR